MEQSCCTCGSCVVFQADFLFVMGTHSAIFFHGKTICLQDLKLASRLNGYGFEKTSDKTTRRLARSMCATKRSSSITNPVRSDVPCARIMGTIWANEQVAIMGFNHL